MGYIHNLPISSVDLVVALICVPERQIVEFTCDVMSSTGILVPIGMDTLGGMNFLVAIVVILAVAGPAVLRRTVINVVVCFGGNSG
jgi:hypothetical protein